jgi:hypothetical protein
MTKLTGWARQAKVLALTPPTGTFHSFFLQTFLYIILGYRWVDLGTYFGHMTHLKKWLLSHQNPYYMAVMSYNIGRVLRRHHITCGKRTLDIRTTTRKGISTYSTLPISHSFLSMWSVWVGYLYSSDCQLSNDVRYARGFLSVTNAFSNAC